MIKELTTYLHGAVSRLARKAKPVIMAVNGVAAGGGMSLALAGDLVVAAESAKFTMAYSKIAASPDGSSSYFSKELAKGPTIAFGRAKLLFHQSTQESLESQVELEAQAIAASGHTEDFRNGVAAFARKLPPVFHGR